MSEVDRLSNSGLYPVLPMGDKRQSQRGPASSDAKPDKPRESEGAESAATAAHPIPKSLLDEYA